MRFILTVLISGLFVFTSEAFALNLEKALQAAENNHQRIVQSQANVDLAQANTLSARSGFLPRLDLSYSYTNRDKDPFQSGSESSVLALNGSLNLFNGLQTTHRYKAAQYRSKAAEHQLKGIIADIFLTTKQAYIDVLRAQKSVLTAKEGVDLLTRQRHDAQLQFDYGLIARNDLLRIEVELSSAKQQLITTEGQTLIARRQLERVTGLQLSKEPLTEGGFQKTSWQAEDISDYQEELIQNRSELNYLRQQQLAGERDKAASQGSYLPRIDLTLAHEEYGDALAPGDLPHMDDSDNKLMLSAQWSLFDGFARRSAVHADDARLRVITAELRNTQEELLLQLSAALQNNFIAEGKRLEAQTGVTQAEENYRVTENRYQQQQATTVDLLDAQFLLTRARNQEISARYDLYLATAVLERILEREPF